MATVQRATKLMTMAMGNDDDDGDDTTVDGATGYHDDGDGDG
jgi:hypothetical protein